MFADAVASDIDIFLKVIDSIQDHLDRLNDDRKVKLYYCSKYYVACRLSISKTRVDLDLFKTSTWP